MRRPGHLTAAGPARVRRAITAAGRQHLFCCVRVGRAVPEPATGDTARARVG
jgi:hypothetical protein